MKNKDMKTVTIQLDDESRTKLIISNVVTMWRQDSMLYLSCENGEEWEVKLDGILYYSKS